MSTSALPRTRDQELIETLHGVPVADPYRWLEDGESAETREWVDAQNAFTQSVLESLPPREAIHSALESLLTVGSVGTPTLRGTRAFYQPRHGRLDQPVLVLREKPDTTE